MAPKIEDNALDLMFFTLETNRINVSDDKLLDSLPVKMTNPRKV